MFQGRLNAQRHNGTKSLEEATTGVRVALGQSSAFRERLQDPSFCVNDGGSYELLCCSNQNNLNLGRVPWPSPSPCPQSGQRSYLDPYVHEVLAEMCRHPLQHRSRSIPGSPGTAGECYLAYLSTTRHSCAPERGLKFIVAPRSSQVPQFSPPSPIDKQNMFSIVIHTLRLGPRRETSCGRQSVRYEKSNRGT